MLLQFSIRGLRLYFPAMKPWVARYVSLLGLPATAWPALFHNPPPCWVRQPTPCCEASPPPLRISAPPTSLDECFFFIFLVVGLPYSSIFCQFWLFLNCCCPSFGCARRQCVYLHLRLGWNLCSRIFAFLYTF